ncbi:hypothetical protein ACS15_5349 [Ralstonia insidiosa]|uniref:Uncharacterized protein n=1 Tax=Ralstonia insidiosa TaxID=190721 RepID=A0AAC9FSU8_9RALS|nr:hypothetical protein ACS15_5349 [Ralstonia insidiosa]
MRPRTRCGDCNPTSLHEVPPSGSAMVSSAVKAAVSGFPAIVSSGRWRPIPSTGGTCFKCC